MVVSGQALHSLDGICEVINDLFSSGILSHFKRNGSRTNQPGDDHSSETQIRLILPEWNVKY